MTKNEVQALGWAYGRLIQVLGNRYFSVVRFQNANMCPITGLALAHIAAIKNRVMTPDLEADLAKALDLVDIDSINWKDEPVLPARMQGIWQIAFMKGRDGEELPTG